MFRHLVAPSLARSILEQFLVDGTVTCKEDESKEVEVCHALEAEYTDVIAHACLPSDVPPNDTPSPATKWDWWDFPTTPIDESKLVAFLNTVADKALSTAKSILGDNSLKPRNRFAAPTDKHCGIPLSYGPCRVALRPDFMVLPLAAFSDDEECKVNKAYVNFTTMLLAGESKSAPDKKGGLTGVQRYIRGIRRAQPWLRFVTGMTVGKDFVALLSRGFRGTEYVEMSLTDGRGCLEVIRIVLGIVLAEKEEFGHDPDVEMGETDVSVDVPELGSADIPRTCRSFMTSDSTSQWAISSTFRGSAAMRDNCYSTSSGFASTDKPSASSNATSEDRTTSTRSNRDPDGTNQEGKEKGARRRVTLRAFIPVRVHGYQCIGILFASGSMHGRGTTVYTVVAADDGKTYLALKMCWQDVARVSDQMIVLNKLSVHNQHPNIVIPSSLEPKCKGGKLGLIGEFLAEDTQQLKMENRILSVTISELRRPVAYFWSPHDFVRGVIGALLGHQYLCEIGILHCDISENNIVLSLCQRGLGALIDFDMAIAGHPNVHLDSPPPRRIRTNDEILASLVQRSSLLPADGTSHEAQPTVQYRICPLACLGESPILITMT
ncbi:hypothetical protein PISMIDRAFT_403191 [Pisolithus microcarpus 441]|uniref:Protein kinase domain-containing protein n=1 Tax=Pisolithus microcarpus 441 TaxID=765257 RepID=A0A0C9Z5Z9_9AGAM|nr:hypothetical protein PISMIDRAFT_403191 [Pisolithus microcarpus 441]